MSYTKQVMKKENLVYLRDDKSINIGSITYDPNRVYRCLGLGNDEQIEYMVFGLVMDSVTFNKHFEFAYNRIMRHFQQIGLLTNDGKPLSKTAFIKLADIHTYGTGRNSINIWYFRNSKDVIYGFYPMQSSKKEQATECYKYYLDLISGEMDCVDCGDVCFGNKGIPLQYGKLGVW